MQTDCIITDRRVMACDISIITVNYNGLEDTCALLDSIPLTGAMEVIVVDNGSTNNEAGIIESRYPEIKAIRSDKNLGFAGGNNLGIQYATGKYLFLVNNDTFFQPFNIQPLIDRLNSSSVIGIVCPKIRFAWDDRPIQFAGYSPLSRITVRNHAIGFGEHDSGQHDTPHAIPYAHGAAMIINREALERVGTMPEDYFLYYEELDWSIMFTQAGYEIWYEPGCTVYHKESRSTGQNSPLRVYYLTRNRLYLVSRHSPPIDKYLSYAYLIGIAYIKSIIIYTVQGHFGHAKAVISGIRDFILKRYGKQT